MAVWVRDRPCPGPYKGRTAVLSKALNAISAGDPVEQARVRGCAACDDDADRGECDENPANITMLHVPASSGLMVLLP